MSGVTWAIQKALTSKVQAWCKIYESDAQNLR